MPGARVSNPEELVISQEEFVDIEEKMEEILSDLEWRVLMSYLDGKSYQEIAVDLDRHVKSIDNALQRVKRKLERYMENRGDEVDITTVYRGLSTINHRMHEALGMGAAFRMQGEGARKPGGGRLLTVGSRESSDAKACRKARGKVKCMEKLKRIRKLDWFILVAAVWLMATLDYDNLQTIDIAYLVSMALWTVFLVMRVVFDLPHEKKSEVGEEK